MDRRTFVKTLAGLASAAALPLRAAAQVRSLDSVPTRTLQPSSASMPALSPAPAPAPSPTPIGPAPDSASTSRAATASTSTGAQNSGYLTGPMFLLLEGAAAGPLRSVEGGDATAEVVSQAPGADGIVHKQPGSFGYTDVVLELGETPSSAVLKWVKTMLDRKAARHSGAIVSVDATGSKATKRELHEALITEVRVPELDASDKGTVYLTLALAVERTGFAAGDPAVASGAKASASKGLHGNTFRLSIAGLETACTRVTKIEALSIKQKVSADAIGARREATREPDRLEVSNLVVTLGDAYAQPFYEWAEDFLVKGNVSGEKTGKLELLAPNLKDVLLTLTFQGLGVFQVRPLKAVSGGDGPRRTQVSMYCERIGIK